jgi:hypothetical protein
MRADMLADPSASVFKLSEPAQSCHQKKTAARALLLKILGKSELPDPVRALAKPERAPICMMGHIENRNRLMSNAVFPSFPFIP